MAIHLLVDGYNLLLRGQAALPWHSDLEQAREQLLSRLAAYRKLKRHKITLVFDSQYVAPLAEQRERVAGVQVVYTRFGETADTAILRRARELKDAAVVITSDNALAESVRRVGATQVSSEEFSERLAFAELNGLKGLVEEVADPPKSLTTKKKGNPRKAKKSERKKKTKLSKL